MLDEAAADCRICELETPDGRRLFARRWGAKGAASVFLVVHGLGEHGGWYQRFAERMVEAGHGVLVYDQQGHGFSPGKRGVVGDFDQLVADVDVGRQAIQENWPDAHLILLGHSMGGNVVLNHLLQSPDRQLPAVVTNPMVQPKPSPTRPQIFAAWLTGKLIPWIRVAGPDDPTKMTGDREILKEYVHDPFLHRKLTLRLGTQLLAKGQWAIDHASELKMPLLVLVGGEDEICDDASLMELVEHAGDQCRIEKFENLRHHLLVERERHRVFDTILEWVA